MNPQVPEKDSLKLKHYFQIGIIGGLFIAMVGAYAWFQQEPEGPKVVVEESLENSEESGMDLRLEEELEAKLAQNSPPEAETKKGEAVDLAKASENFGKMMKPLALCLSLTNLRSEERLDPSLEALLAAIKEDLGEPILRSEDWVTWSLKVGSEERRIRIETDYSDSDQSSRRLLYFKVDAQGQPTLIPISNEQSKDPTETFIASLQKDGEVYEEEKGERAYFENGQEMVLSEKNGKIDDLEVSNGSKTFRCAGILTSSPACKCY